MNWAAYSTLKRHKVKNKPIKDTVILIRVNISLSINGTRGIAVLLPTYILDSTSPTYVTASCTLYWMQSAIVHPGYVTLVFVGQGRSVSVLVWGKNMDNTEEDVPVLSSWVSHSAIQNKRLCLGLK